MNLEGFVIRNALRNKRRAALSVCSMAVSLFLLVTMLTLRREFALPPEDVGASLRIAVRNKVALGVPLPARQLQVLDRVPGVAAVTPFTFFGGRFRDQEFTPFAQFGVEPERFTNVFVEAKAPPEQLAAWLRDRTSCLVGAVLGAGGAWLLFNSVDIRTLSNGIFLYFEVTPRILGTAFGVAAALGIIASIAPALAVARTSVVEGLRTLD
jgi:putative ABC transport system permease protein